MTTSLAVELLHDTGVQNGLVSCVIPAYNSARFLGETLTSVLAQTHPVHEILVVDDGSTDATREVVEEFISKHPSIIKYFWQENSGGAAARNAGIRASVGEFLAFLDADDLWMPEKMERQLARFAARPELGIAVTHLQNFWMDEVREEEERLRDHPRGKPLAGYSFSTVMVRRNVLAQIGLLDPKLLYADDTEWFMRARDAGIIDEVLPEVLTRRRLHQNNLTRTYPAQIQAEYLRLLKERTRRGQPVQPTQTTGA